MYLIYSFSYFSYGVQIDGQCRATIQVSTRDEENVKHTKEPNPREF